MLKEYRDMEENIIALEEQLKENIELNENRKALAERKLKENRELKERVSVLEKQSKENMDTYMKIYINMKRKNEALVDLLEERVKCPVCLEVPTSAVPTAISSVQAAITALIQTAPCAEQECSRTSHFSPKRSSRILNTAAGLTLRDAKSEHRWSMWRIIRRFATCRLPLRSLQRESGF